jgi:hypothetical protein
VTPVPLEGATGAKTGANVPRPLPIPGDPLGAFSRVRVRGPRFGLAQTRAYPPGLLRDEEAAGSNPATPTRSSSWSDGTFADHSVVPCRSRQALGSQTGSHCSRGFCLLVLGEDGVHGLGALGNHRVELVRWMTGSATGKGALECAHGLGAIWPFSGQCCVPSP